MQTEDINVTFFLVIFSAEINKRQFATFRNQLGFENLGSIRDYILTDKTRSIRNDQARQYIFSYKS